MARMELRTGFSTVTTVAVSAALLFGCGGEETRDIGPGKGPGATAWDSDDVGCTESAECGQGEVCEDGVCQMARCADAYESALPLGENYFFGLDQEFAVVGDGTYIDGVEPAAFGYLGSWELSQEIKDVTGGNLSGKRPHAIVAAVENSDVVYINDPNLDAQLSIGIWPEAMAAGDVDKDGIDELISIGKDGTFSLCHAEIGQCAVGQIGDAEGTDVTIADVDGDGYEEPMFLLRFGGNTTLVIWNVDYETTGQEPSLAWEFNFPLKSIAAGDLDGDGIAEVIGIEDGGWWDIANDKLHAFSPASGQLIGSRDIYGHSNDLDVGDRNSDRIDEVVLLRDDHKFELIGGTSLDTVTVNDIPIGSNVSRIAMLDWDGDTASGRLVEGPTLAAGEVIPLGVAILPPYDKTVADGESSVFLGNRESTSETFSDTVSLQLGGFASYGADIGGLLKAEVSFFMSQEVAKSQSFTTTKNIGQRVSVSADPDQYGDDYAAVVLSCGCFHKYTYATDDPAGKVGGSGQNVDIFIPVGGQTGMWSTKRYNAVAAATGKLPIINLPHRIGDVDTYFGEPLNLNGGAIAPEDFVFTELPTFQASDIGSVGFWLSAGESETNETSVTTTVGMKGSLGFLGAGVGIDVSASQAAGYSISVGQTAEFGGGIPPIPDDASTPEDEYETHRYAYTPYVYREHYVDRAGEPASYYVVNYTVAK